MTDMPDNNTPDAPELPSPATDAPLAGPDGGQRAARGGLPTPSARVTAILAATMLAVGVAVGAAIGPAPQASLANPALLPGLMATLAARAAAATRAGASAAPAPQASGGAEAEPRRRKRRRRHHGAAEAAAASEEPAQTPQASTPSSSPTKGTTTTAALAPVSKVWLIQLAGSTFAEAAAHSAAAPYISTQAIPAGTLLSEWTGLDGAGFASDAALIAGPSPQLLDTIVQPPCPEGAAGTACAAGTPGALTAADEFLKATVPTITALGTFRANGLIVVTFASVTSATATGLPAGATSATLTAAPPAGVLLISPFAKAGSKPATTFTPATPTKSIEALLHS